MLPSNRSMVNACTVIKPLDISSAWRSMSASQLGKIRVRVYELPCWYIWHQIDNYFGAIKIVLYYPVKNMFCI